MGDTTEFFWWQCEETFSRYFVRLSSMFLSDIEDLLTFFIDAKEVCTCINTCTATLQVQNRGIALLNLCALSVPGISIINVLTIQPR